ncbi:phage holin family protein [Pseudomonas sp. UL073]|uniref:Phage holin family protein n=2 Tax=Zestomonas insulae TaxID=2809017 RepID=A0ABS2ICU1_9GAMM|nr:phage holin family protein [Pseudomonas insulae]MBM7060931.1 phage holin family protein [Pseudomonas insulae]
MESQAADDRHGASPRRLGAAVLGLLHDHVELFGIELQEQKGRSLRLLLFAGFSLIFGLLLIVGLSSVLIVALWDTEYRMPAMIGLCLLYAIATGYCAVRLHAAVTDESSPFSATLQELARDRERLQP